MFMDSLNVEEVIAQLLVTEGFTTVEDVAYTETRGAGRIAGLRRGDRRARSRSGPRPGSRSGEQKFRAEAEELGIAEDLAGYDGRPTRDASSALAGTA